MKVTRGDFSFLDDRRELGAFVHEQGEVGKGGDGLAVSYLSYVGAVTDIIPSKEVNTSAAETILAPERLMCEVSRATELIIAELSYFCLKALA